MCALYLILDELKNPPHSLFRRQPSHSGMYSFFQSDMLRRLKEMISGSRNAKLVIIN